MLKKKFQTPLALRNFFISRHDTLDAEGTRQAKRWGLVTEDGKLKSFGGIKPMCTYLNEEHGGDYEVSICRSLGGLATVVYYKGELNEVVEAPVEQPEPVVVEDEPVIESEPEVVAEDVQEDSDGGQESPDGVDWKWIESLANTKEDKSEFKAYAADQFDIELKGNLKLEGLIEKFKEALEAK